MFCLPLRRLLAVVAGENFALGCEPILILIAGSATSLQVQLVRALADLHFQIGWGIVPRRGLPNQSYSASFGHGNDLIVRCLRSAGSLCFSHNRYSFGTAKSMKVIDL